MVGFLGGLDQNVLFCNVSCSLFGFLDVAKCSLGLDLLDAFPATETHAQHRAYGQEAIKLRLMSYSPAACLLADSFQKTNSFNFTPKKPLRNPLIPTKP